jgi:regulatory protein
VGEAEIEGVVALLSDAGAIDDHDFARRYAEDKRQLAGWGPERIERGLQVRGVAAEHIEAALAMEDERQQLERAALLLATRGMSCATDPERERALGLLVRRGYALELAYEVVRAAERATRRAA